MRGIAVWGLLAFVPVCYAFSPISGPQGVFVRSLGRFGTPPLRSGGARICPPGGSSAQPGPALAGGIGPAGIALKCAPRVRRGVGLWAMQEESDVDAELFKDALVDFKGAPCVVQTVSEKAEILQLTGKSRKAKYKDLQVVFPGPVRSWELQELGGKPPKPVAAPEKVHAELLDSGDTVTVCELAHMLFQTEATHAEAWAAWLLVREGLYFTGTSQEISPHPAEKVARDLEAMRQKKAREKEEADFIKRIETKTVKPADIERMRDLEALALNQADTSPTLKMLGIQQTPQEAHRLLLELGVWDGMTNPWPARFGVNLEAFGEELEAEAARQVCVLCVCVCDSQK